MFNKKLLKFGSHPWPDKSIDGGVDGQRNKENDGRMDTKIEGQTDNLYIDREWYQADKRIDSQIIWFKWKTEHTNSI